MRAIALSILLLAGCGSAAREHLGDHADMPAGHIGSDNVKFLTSCAAPVREDFNKGVALLHSFWFAEATRTFESIAERDPDCAMAYWGMALSQWNNPFAGLKAVGVIERGQSIIQKARTTGQPTSRERSLIEAVALLFRSSEAAGQRERVLAYEAAMAKVAQDFPDDTELRIFWALAIAQLAVPTDKTHADLLRAATVLEPLFEKFPEHPGLAHYIIHAYDAPTLATRALSAARRYAELAPAVPHALHMPSHTFTRLGAWRDSIASNTRSAEVSRKNNEAGDELHALDYLVYAYLQTANDRAASEVLVRAATITASTTGNPVINPFAVSAIPARYAIERGDWAAAAALTPHPGLSPSTEAITRFARALGASRSGNPSTASADISRLAELRDTLRAMSDAYWAEQVDIQRQVAIAWQSHANGESADAIAQLIAAAEAEEKTDKAAVTPGPILPARESLGDLLLLTDRPGEALAAFEAALAREPNRFHALAGAGRAATAAGDRVKAVNYYTQLLAICDGADSQRPELLAAQQALGHKGSTATK